MEKPASYVWVGIDISAKKLDVAIYRNGIEEPTKQFPNDKKGHKDLIKELRPGKQNVRVTMEATGTYGFELALALEAVNRIEVMISDPRKIKNFGVAFGKRCKTDRADAVLILRYGRCNCTEWKPWKRPSDAYLKLRQITRRIQQLTDQSNKEKSRKKAKKYEGKIGKAIIPDLDKSLKQLEDRMKELRKEAIKLIDQDPELKRKFGLLVSFKGLGEASSITILGELCLLPEDMKAAQWVSCAGLDPRIQQSGSSLNKRGHISKRGNSYLRKALFMPSVAALRWNPNVIAFAKRLVGRGKQKMVALVAVMRKLLHAIWGMFTHNTPFDGERFCPAATPSQTDSCLEMVAAI